mgnify:FL=1
MKRFSIHIHTSSTAHLGTCDSLLLILGVSGFQTKADQVKSKAAFLCTLSTIRSLLGRLLARARGKNGRKSSAWFQFPVSRFSSSRFQLPRGPKTATAAAPSDPDPLIQQWVKLSTAHCSPLQPTQPNHSIGGLRVRGHPAMPRLLH